MASYQAGFQAKARLGPSGTNPTTAYAIARYTIADECQEQDVSNTEGIGGNPSVLSNTPGFGSYIGGLRRFTANLVNATYDALANPFAAPLSLASNIYIAVRVFLGGAPAPLGVSWLSTSFFINRISMDGDVRGLQPITVAGIGDGTYTDPFA